MTQASAATPLSLPEPDTTRLSRSPLELVVCQVRHDRRLVMAESSTALAMHEALGGPDGRYPVLDPVKGTEVTMAVGLGAPNLQETTTSGWRFASADGKWVITLMPEAFSIETSAYSTWEDDFVVRLGELVDLVASHVEPTLEHRIGLRYVDRISELGLTEIAAWAPYLSAELLGLALHPQLGPGVRDAQQQVVIEMEPGVQGVLRHGPIIEPGRDTVDYQLDFDIFRQGGRAFDAEAIKDAAAQFNVYGLQLFQATVTDELLEKLR